MSVFKMKTKCVRKEKEVAREVAQATRRRTRYAQYVERRTTKQDPDQYRNFLRMDNECFTKFLGLVKSDIEKESTHLREPVTAENRLAVTLRYLASGNSFRDLMLATRIHESTISLIVPEVYDAIITRLMSKYIKLPSSEQEWRVVAEEFDTLWNFPMCSGAIDGKHINFDAPKSSGSFYYNYKGSHSIVLLASVQAKYKFLYVDVGVNGRISDGGVYRESSLKKGIDQSLLNIPYVTCLPGTNITVSPHVIVGDDASPLSNRLMKPYPQRGLSIEKRIFNYRLSRARRIVENSFGILVNRFRILHNTINLSPDKVETLTLAFCVLHNFLSKNNPNYTNLENEKCDLRSISQKGGSRHSTDAINAREKYRNYFNTSGAVPWQLLFYVKL